MKAEGKVPQKGTNGTPLLTCLPSSKRWCTLPELKRGWRTWRRTPLKEHMTRQLDKSLVANNLILSKMQRAKELANQEVLQSTELKRRVTGLSLEVEELRKTD